MTIAEFLAELRKTPRRWRLEPCGTRMLLRNTSSLCPIQAVYNRMGSSGVGFHECARVLGLGHDDTNRIAWAADGCPVGTLRAQLLEACGVRP